MHELMPSDRGFSNKGSDRMKIEHALKPRGIGCVPCSAQDDSRTKLSRMPATAMTDGATSSSLATPYKRSSRGARTPGA